MTSSDVVTRKDIAEAPTRAIEEIIRSRVPGVHLVRSADGGFSIRLRGTQSIYASNEPLVVLDGMPLSSDGGLGFLNPHDVESIEVLRDPASTAMYGVRGANGVILIRTRHDNSQ
ncbi:MAG: TonB-dependent receptor plug domain-containing protein [Rhodothermales bacterium]